MSANAWCRTTAPRPRRRGSRAAAPMPSPCPWPLAQHLAPDQLDGGGDRVQARAELAREALELVAARGGDAVEAARAALRMLPFAAHEALGLERAQQRVH